MNRLTWCCLLASFGLLSVACGGSESKEDDEQGEGEGGAGGTSSPGTGGSFRLGDGGLGCGQALCFPPLEMPEAKECCKDAFASACGMMSTQLGQTSCVDLPAPPSTECTEGYTFQAGAMSITLVGCCTEAAKCGLDGTSFGQGCIEWSVVADQAQRFGGITITVPPEKTCTP